MEKTLLLFLISLNEFYQFFENDKRNRVLTIIVRNFNTLKSNLCHTYRLNQDDARSNIRPS